MRATTVMLLALGLLVIGHWANNKPSVSVKLVVEFGFALMLIAFLDHGRTEQIASGFAWLFLVAVLLGSSSPISGLAKATQTKPAAAKTPPVQVA